MQILRKLITSDDLVGVKMFKIKLLSNLVNHTVRENVSASDKAVGEGTYAEVLAIVRAFKENQYREQLLVHSSDFKEEKKRLEKIA